MWSNPSRSGAVDPPSPDDWETLFDSGQLETQLNGLRVSKPVQSGSHAVQGGYFAPGGYQPAGYGPPPGAGGLLPTPNPALMLPPPVFGRRSAGGHPYSRPPPPIVRAGGSAFPPPISPYPAGPRLSPAGGSAGPSIGGPGTISIVPRPQIMVRPSGDNSLHTEYQPPEPKLKILKRPSSSPSNLAAQGGSAAAGNAASAKPKSLKQREEEYAQARLRILGSRGEASDETDENETFNGHSDPGSPVSGAPSTVTPTHSLNAITRAPKGPDGTKGFQASR